MNKIFIIFSQCAELAHRGANASTAWLSSFPCVELNEPVFGAPGELIGTMEEGEEEEMVVVFKAKILLG